jgi:hypothetical protein
MAPPRPLFIPELLRQAGQHLEALATRAEELAAVGTNSSHDPHIGQALDHARRILELRDAARSQ